ncbi:hypothetical protein QBC36DRAFT_332304 [Triangularia setosa]|uniref:Uncharacterized protein n=1 Tax=Triangularia setosa TaxID=2587417 RepID=A0AAN6W4U6_9PEZI|nr:hypothetical protein QBC36DRAFT_332304 [Podospora setosa]
MAKGSKSVYHTIDPPFVYAASAIVEGIFTLLFVSTFAFGILRLSAKVRPIWYYYTAAMAALLIGYILRIASFSVYAYYDKPEVYLAFEDRYLFMLLSAKRLEPVARLFRHMGAALCSVLLVEIGQRYSWVWNKRTPLRIGRAAVWMLAGGASVLALAHCILAEREINPDLNVVERLGMPRLDDVFNGDKTVAALVSAVLLLLFAGGLMVLAMVIHASHAALSEDKRTAPSHDVSIHISISTLLLVASVILVIVRGWNMAEVSLLLNPHRRAKANDMAWWYWCELALDRFGTWVVLFVVYRVGKKALVLDRR